MVAIFLQNLLFRLEYMKRSYTTDKNVLVLVVSIISKKLGTKLIPSRTVVSALFDLQRCLLHKKRE